MTVLSAFEFLQAKQRVWINSSRPKKIFRRKH